ADRLSQELVDTLRRGGARTLTVASDGASQRMRDLVDRKHSEEQLLRVARFVAKRHTPLDGSPFAGIRTVERRLAQLRTGLRGKADVRPTSARWAWVEYMLAQCGPEAGLAALEAWRAGGTFAAFRRAFAERGCTPFLAARVEDGRRHPTAWPTVPGPGRPAAEAGA